MDRARGQRTADSGRRDEVISSGAVVNVGGRPKSRGSECRVAEAVAEAEAETVAEWEKMDVPKVGWGWAA